MTKMPDKIFAIRRYNKITAFKFPSSFLRTTEYTRSDLIPQTITDEARQRALDWFNSYAWCLSSEMDKEHPKTIRVALSQPTPLDDFSYGLKLLTMMGFTHKMDNGDHVVSGHGFEKRHTSLLCIADRIKDRFFQSTPQPEAIQNAVEALEKLSRLSFVNTTNKQISVESHVDLVETIRDALTHQSELEALNGTLDSMHQTNQALCKRLQTLKAENAELCQAVVDLDAALNRHGEKSYEQITNADTIAKAKEVIG